MAQTLPALALGYLVRAGYPARLQVPADLVEYRGVVDGRGHGVIRAVGNLAHRGAQYLAGARLWEPR